MPRKTANASPHADKPYVDNYPPLRDWLREHNARCEWQVPIGDRESPQAYVECWRVYKGAVVLLIQANQNGWEIFSSLNTNKVQESLDDALARCRGT